MKNLSLPQLIGVSVLLAVVGGALYVQFCGWWGDEDPNVFLLLAVGIGTVIGFLADHRKHARLVVLTAVVCSVACCLIGNFRVAMLKRAAIAFEFDREALASEEFFVALEAYLSKYDNDPSAPPFTYVSHQEHYSEDEWHDAGQRWQNKSPDERDTIRNKWLSDYDRLNRLGDEGVWNVFFASWYWSTYLIAAAIAGAIVALIQYSERSGNSDWS